jgi:hypothetical protein
VASVRRPLLGLVLLTLAGPALAQGPAGQAEPPKGADGTAAPGASGQSKSWADEVRSSVGPHKQGGGGEGGQDKSGQGGGKGGGQGQPKQ